MTLAITKEDNNIARISQHAHMTEWGLDIQEDQLDHVIYHLQRIRQEIKDDKSPSG